jgi:hypothetical protein
MCPLHPEGQPNVILEGDSRITDHGVPVGPRAPRHVRMQPDIEPRVMSPALAACTS